mmetsp:Transcript_27286/g.67319  ORF Transcript_27286/g.67319 Transcript_27286/m.67319 type:complete len:643 (-) Transcript_27286:194-2122(-)
MLSLLGLVDLFMQLGQAFSGEAPTVLRASVRTKSGSFYAAFHRERLDELRMRLENELWQRMPLNADALRSAMFAPPLASKSLVRQISMGGNSADRSAIETVGSSSHFPASYSTLEPLLDAELIRQAAKGEEDGLWIRWVKLSERDPEGEPAARSVGAVAAVPTGEDGRLLAVCGTALNFAKIVHRYVHVMATLHPIAADAFAGIAGLFELLLLAVFTQFWGGPKVGSPLWDEGPFAETLAPRLKGTLLRLHHVYVEGQQGMGAQPNSTAAETASAIRQTALRLVGAMPPPSQPGSSARLGPQESICAAESLQFIAAVLISARPRIEELISAAYSGSAPPQLAQVASFYAQSIDSVPHLTEAIHRALVRKTLDLTQASVAVGTFKWDLREIGTNESAYVHQFVSSAQTAATHIGLLPLGNATVIRLHAMICDVISAALVEGYAMAKKCSNEGRAQMSIDLKTIQVELSQVLKCPVSLTRADAYIKAYYKSAGELVGWARDHPEISGKQLLSLVNCHFALKKKERDDLLKALDEVRNGEVSRAITAFQTLESYMPMSSNSSATAAVSRSDAAADVEVEGTPNKTAHKRVSSGGPPRTFGSMTKWAQGEAAAKLKAASNAAASATRRPASTGADGADGAAGPAPT